MWINKSKSLRIRFNYPFDFSFDSFRRIRWIRKSVRLIFTTFATDKSVERWRGAKNRQKRAVVVPVTSDSRGPRFESSHRQKKILNIYTVNCIEKTKIMEKRPGLAHFLKRRRKRIESGEEVWRNRASEGFIIF